MTGLGYLGKSASTYLVLLLGVIEANDWQKFETLALDKPEAFRCLAERISKSSGFNGMTLLHACVRFNPPFIVVQKIIKLCPDAPKAQDCLNRTPLHVAAGTGASAAVIKVLVDAYPDACLIQDDDGRTPLHLACDSSCELFEGSANTPREAPTYEVVHTLLVASMSVVPLEDEEGMSALEYAIFSNANIKVVKLLQRATQEEFRKKHQEAQRVSVEYPRKRLSAPSA